MKSELLGPTVVLPDLEGLSICSEFSGCCWSRDCTWRAITPGTLYFVK